MFGLGFLEIAGLVILGVLLFGKGLPGIAQSLGKSIVGFKQGLKGIEDDLDGPPRSEPRPEAAGSTAARPPQRVASAPKFEDVASST
jgi:Sec-independent protein translocase protein TatA